MESVHTAAQILNEFKAESCVTWYQLFIRVHERMAQNRYGNTVVVHWSQNGEITLSYFLTRIGSKLQPFFLFTVTEYLEVVLL
jgi:hypothetical protein